jgi:hypothetical protein
VVLVDRSADATAPHGLYGILDFTCSAAARRYIGRQGLGGGA